MNYSKYSNKDLAYYRIEQANTIPTGFRGVYALLDHLKQPLYYGVQTSLTEARARMRHLTCPRSDVIKLLLAVQQIAYFVGYPLPDASRATICSLEKYFIYRDDPMLFNKVCLYRCKKPKPVAVPAGIPDPISVMLVPHDLPENVPYWHGISQYIVDRITDVIDRERPNDKGCIAALQRQQNRMETLFRS